MNQEQLRKELLEDAATNYAENTIAVGDKDFLLECGFKAGAEYEAERDKWISVDEVPLISGPYLVWNTNLISGNKTERGYFFSYNNQWMNDCNDIIHPTRYQDLPSPPNTSK